MPAQADRGTDQATVRAVVLRAAQSLGGDTSRIDAELLLCRALDRPRAWLYAHPDAVVDSVALADFAALVARRRAGEPVAYLRGSQEFWSLELCVSAATLIPRPETELLVELALAHGPAPGSRTDALDLGSGSGAIALALARERPAWSVLGVDRDDDALRVARANAARLGIANAIFEAGDWYGGLAGRRFALVVSNPPYIRDDDACLAELRFEPRHALVAGRDGLDALRTVIAHAPRHLQPGGWLLCEHGAGQGEAVRALFARAGFEAVQTRRDLAAHERVTLGRDGRASGEASG